MTETPRYPFTDSLSAAHWAAETLLSRGLDEVGNWRMLEYWFQVELFRAIETGAAGAWRHIGDYEHPYYTELPKSGSKTNTKWVDLVLAEPNLSAPKSIMWVELKDLGRSPTTLVNNAKGLGHDLAALWAIDPVRTEMIWKDPPAHVVDRGRYKEWSRFGRIIGGGSQRIAQIVICHKSLASTMSPEEVAKTWLATFLQRVSNNSPSAPLEVQISETNNFVVFGLIGLIRQ